MEKYKSFIPTYFFDTQKKDWKKINKNKEEYLYEVGFKSVIESITELSDNIFYVTWLEEIGKTDCIYKGIVEYTDEYQKELEAELKELSKDFKFKL